MSINYSYVKNGFFMIEKFNFENLSAFKSAEGIIFYPLAVESADFPQLRSIFYGLCTVESLSRPECYDFRPDHKFLRENGLKPLLRLD